MALRRSAENFEIACAATAVTGRDRGTCGGLLRLLFIMEAFRHKTRIDELKNGDRSRPAPNEARAKQATNSRSARSQKPIVR